MVHIYTGDGKGKTTAALGLSFRAAGRGLRVAFLEFLKDGNSGEVLLAKSVPNMNIRCFQTTVNGFFWNMTEPEREELKAETQAGFAFAANCAANRLCDMLVLDEIAGCIANGILSENDVLALLKNYGKTLEIVLTGRDFSQEMRLVADYVSEIQAVKHPFDTGTAPREGIEF